MEDSSSPLSVMDSQSMPVAMSGDSREQTQQAQPQQSQQKGIDIHQALSILSARSSGPSESRPDGGCDCCHGSHVPEDAKSMGQTIDMLAPTSTTTPPSGNETEGESSSIPSDATTLLQKERTERLEKIRQQLLTMTDKELLQAVIKAQEDRVTTYREYER